MRITRMYLDEAECHHISYFLISAQSILAMACVFTSKTVAYSGHGKRAFLAPLFVLVTEPAATWAITLEKLRNSL